jgi:hypothetical protein
MAHQVGVDVAILAEQNPSADLAKMIRKLRWIGLEEEAHQLETILSRYPAGERAAVLANPPSTD